MRPVCKGTSPVAGDFAEYEDAKSELLPRVGHFCSYCERRIATNLAVEHIQPKGLPKYAALEKKWDNFLLACVNCNSTKGDEDVGLNHYYLPDRDNTFAAFDYLPDGTVHERPGDAIGERTLAMTGLNKPIRETLDSNGKRIAMDRKADRMTVWGIAQESMAELAATPTDNMRRQIVRTAMGHGFFSIWMKVFAGDPVVRQMLIDGFGVAEDYRGFPGTAKDCFHPDTSPATPRPPNGLGGAGKI